MLRVFILLLVELIKCHEFVALDLLTLHLEHVNYANHLIAAKFELRMASDILNRQVWYWILDLVVLDLLHDWLKLEAYRRNLAGVLIGLAVNGAPSALSPCGSLA